MSFLGSYVFGKNGLVVLRHKLGHNLAVQQNNPAVLNPNGTESPDAQWHAECDGLDAGFCVLKFKNAFSGKYLRLFKNEIDCSDDGSKFSRFRVHQFGPTSATFESIKFSGKFLKVCKRGAVAGSGDQSCVFHLLTKSATTEAHSSGESVEIFLSCQDLTSNLAYTCVSLKDNATNTFNDIGQTEVSYNSNPKYVKQFVIDFVFEEVQQLRFDVYKATSGMKKNKKSLLGSCTAKLSDVIHSKNQMLTRTLTSGRKVVKNRATKRYSRLNVRLEQVSPLANENVEFGFAAVGLPKMGAFSKCNPVLEIHRLGSDGKFFKVYETEVLHKTLNPEWDRFQITTQKLCNNEFARNLQFKIFHAEKDIRKYVGKIQTNYEQLKDKNVREFALKNTKGKTCGTLKCLRLQVLSTGRPNKARQAAQPAQPAQPQQQPAQPAQPSQQQPGQQQSLQQPAQLMKVPSRQEMLSNLSRGHFLKYLQGACEISLMVSIDFTGSNGHHTNPQSLHYIYDPMKLSPYQQALRTICTIVAPYDSDQKFPVWGFGAQFKDKTIRHDFPVSPNGEEVDGVAGVEHAYLDAIRSGAFEFSGPTYYSPILAKAINMCVAEHNKVVQDKEKKLPIQYFVYLLVTNGSPCEADKQGTRDLLVYASNNNLPLSVIAIGVGDGDFSFLHELDADRVALTDKNGTKAKRDIVQFVPMKEFTGKPITELSKHVLREVPIQFMSYVNANKLDPRTSQPKQVSSAYGYEEEDEDLNNSQYNIPESELLHSNTNNMSDFEGDDGDADEFKLQPDQAAPPSNMANVPLPPGWEVSFTASGKPFYINHNQSTTQWEHPLKNQMQMKPTPQAQAQQTKQHQVYMQGLVNTSMSNLTQPAFSHSQSNPVQRTATLQPQAQVQRTMTMQPGLATGMQRANTMQSQQNLVVTGAGMQRAHTMQRYPGQQQQQVMYNQAGQQVVQQRVVQPQMQQVQQQAQQRIYVDQQGRRVYPQNVPGQAQPRFVYVQPQMQQVQQQQGQQVVYQRSGTFQQR